MTKKIKNKKIHIFLLMLTIFITLILLNIFKNIEMNKNKFGKYMPVEIQEKNDTYLYSLVAQNEVDLYDDSAYSTYDKYLYFDNSESFYDKEGVIIDKKGIPLVLYGEKYYNNPITLSQFALSMYSDYVKTNDPKLKDNFIYLANYLTSLQSEDGAFRYEFEWKYHHGDITYKPGWVSSMSQAQAISVFARAYFLTNDEKYIEHGNKAVDFLLIPTENGGTKSTLKDLDPKFKDNIFFEEYLSEPYSYTLNGYMFTLIGLYDWATIEKDFPNLNINKDSIKYFDEGIESLKIVLPYYDTGGFSTYDLSHITFNDGGLVSTHYHEIHISLLSSLYSVKKDKTLKNFQLLWTKYVENYEYATGAKK